MAYERELTIEELEELLGGALNGLALAITELDTAKDLFARLEPNAAAAQRRRLCAYGALNDCLSTYHRIRDHIEQRHRGNNPV